jgi:hypothetical protein
VKENYDAGRAFKIKNHARQKMRVDEYAGKKLNTQKEIFNSSMFGAHLSI